MTGHRIAALTLVVLLLPASLLAQARVRPAVSAATFFPLTPGNWWSYETRGVGEPTTWRVDVAEFGLTPHANGHLTLRGYFSPGARQVRSHGSGLVTERSSYGGRDLLWYMLGARVGTWWTLQLAALPTAAPVADCVDGSRLAVASRDEVVRVPAGEFRGVVRINFHSRCADAGIVAEWFAPGVGLIRREETSFAGPVVSELLEARIGEIMVPRPGYTTSLLLDRPVYVNNLMPPVTSESLPVARGDLAIRNPTGLTLQLHFSGCRSAQLVVVDETGHQVLVRQIDDGGCCDCENLVTVDLGRGGFSLPFAVRLADERGAPLPDGRYALWVTLDTLDPEPLRPSVHSLIELRSVH